MTLIMVLNFCEILGIAILQSHTHYFCTNILHEYKEHTRLITKIALNANMHSKPPESVYSINICERRVSMTIKIRLSISDQVLDTG